MGGGRPTRLAHGTGPRSNTANCPGHEQHVRPETECKNRLVPALLPQDNRRHHRDAGALTMASSMVDAILGTVTPNMTQALASRLGETPQAVQNGLGAATAATLNGLADKAGDSGLLSQI